MQRSWSKSLSTRRGSTPANRPEGKGATRYPEVAAITATRTKQPTPKSRFLLMLLNGLWIGSGGMEVCFRLGSYSMMFRQGKKLRLVAIDTNRQ